MSPLDGLSEAAKEAPFWTAIATAVGGALSAIGARRAGDRLREWAAARSGPGGGREDVIDALRGIQAAIREEGEATRREIRQEGTRGRQVVHALSGQVSGVRTDQAVILERLRKVGS